MGQTARHLGPGLRALRRNQRRHILEHQQAHIADGGIGQQCAPQYQRDHVMLQAFVRGGVELQRVLPVLVRGLAGPALIHLRRRIAPRHIDCVGRLRLLMLDQALELLLHRLPHLMQIGNILEPVTEQLRGIDSQNAAGSRIGRQHRAIGGEQHHAGTQVVQNGLQFGTRGVQFRHAVGQRLAGIGQLLRHGGKGLRQPAQFVIALVDALGPQVTRRHLAHPFGQHQQRTRQLRRQHRGQQHGPENRQNQRERERSDEHARHAGACQCALLVYAVGLLYRQRIGQQFCRDHLYHLQHPDIALQHEVAGAHHRIGHHPRPAGPRRLLRPDWVGGTPVCLLVQTFHHRHDQLRLELLQHVRRRRQLWFGQLRRTGAGNALPLRAPEHHVVGMLLQTQTLEFLRQIEAGNNHQLFGCRLGLDGRIARVLVEQVAAQTEAGVERPLHPHVEPAFDRARHELVGHQIDQCARHTGHQHEGRRQLEQQPAAELATPET